MVATQTRARGRGIVGSGSPAGSAVLPSLPAIGLQAGRRELLSKVTAPHNPNHHRNPHRRPPLEAGGPSGGTMSLQRRKRLERLEARKPRGRPFVDCSPWAIPFLMAVLEGRPYCSPPTPDVEPTDETEQAFDAPSPIWIVWPPVLKRAIPAVLRVSRPMSSASGRRTCGRWSGKRRRGRAPSVVGGAVGAVVAYGHTHGLPLKHAYAARNRSGDCHCAFTWPTICSAHHRQRPVGRR
jgi:hypothetical protein